jgi:ubiquinone/menaquinone biosynthesis C-methylase UbiE
MNLYDLPAYYYLSYSWNMHEELVFLKKVFFKYTKVKLPRLLEPACGTGRLLVPLVKSGFDCTGFDCNPHALNYLKKNCNAIS